MSCRRNCHCGWSKETTYHGLRVHQGRNGCTPKGMRISESDQLLFKQSPPKFNFMMRPIHIEEPVVNTYIFSSVFETLQRFRQPDTNMNNPRRALDFGIGDEQVVITPWESPTRKPQNTALRPRAKEEAGDREAGKLLKAKKDKIKADLWQQIQTREYKVAEIKSSAKACKGSLDAEWLEINNVFLEAIRVMEDARQEALQPLEDRRQRVKREAQSLVKNLQREIEKLKKNMDDVDTISDLEVSQVTGLSESKDWKDVDTSFSFASLRPTISAMMEEIQQEVDQLSSVELKRISTFAVDVILDPSTAHPCLAISDDGKKVHDGGKNQQVCTTQGRFDMFGSVLGVNSLTSGKSYWEVEVRNKTGWDLGVTRGKANRKGKLSLNPDNGYWVVVHYNGDKYAALTAPPVRLAQKEKPQKVGVFVDYEEGVVSFYDVMAQSHIYSFHNCSFSGEIFPYFSPHLTQNVKNCDPLIICPVTKQELL